MKKSTDDLFKEIKEKRDIAVYLKENSNELLFSSLEELIEFFIRSKKLNKSRVLDKANLSKPYGYQIIKGEKHPSRDKLIMLSFGLELSVDETNRLLKQAGYSSLYPRIPRDAIIIKGIDKKESLIDTNEKLDEFGEDPLD